jgi:hypothetical protein
MRNLKKLLPGFRREPKIIAIFSNCQSDCDRLIHHVLRLTSNSPAAGYPIHVYSLEAPLLASACAHVVVDADSRRLYRRAHQELAESWVALSATSWNNIPRGRWLKIICMTLPPFRGIALNENGDYFELK